VTAFPETRYSVVQALKSGDRGQRERALALLASIYRAPIEGYLRYRLRGDRTAAEELTQGFFVAVVERDIFGSYLSDKARFRTFLRVCLDRFADTAHRDANRKKRGGGARTVSIDAEQESGRPEIATDEEPPDAIFDREFKRALLAASIEKLKARLSSSGRAHYFHVFTRYDLHDGPEERPTYAKLGEEIGSNAAQVTNHLHATRKELKRILADTLREVCASDEEFEEEARLFGVDPHPP